MGRGDIWIIGSTETSVGASVARLRSRVEAAGSALVLLPSAYALHEALRRPNAPRAVVVTSDAIPWSVVELSASAHDVAATTVTDVLVELPRSVGLMPELRMLARSHPTATLCVSGIDDAERSVRRLLAAGGPTCGTLQLLPALDRELDGVTADQLAFIALASRRPASIRHLASTFRVSTTALRARFARRGLAAPVRVLAACRALHAVILTHQRVPTRVAAKRLGFATPKHLLAHVRRGLGQALSTFPNLETAFGVARTRIYERDGESPAQEVAIR